MALTKEEWYEKLRSWVPPWWFEEERYNVAVMKAIARVFAEVDQAVDDHIGETFISQAEGAFLDAHGDERAIERQVGEVDEDYSPRIRSLVSSPDIESIRAAVGTVLPVGSFLVEEHEYNGLFLSREAFCSRKQVITDIYYNAFSIVIENQGVGSPGDELLESIAMIANKIKGLGVLYRITEVNAS